MAIRKIHRGFSFIETLLGVFLVAISATILASSMPVATLGRNKADQLNKASNYGQKMVEVIRAQGYANLTKDKLIAAGVIDAVQPNDGPFTANNIENAAANSVSQILPQGTCQITISQVDIELRQIIVNIQWIERGAQRNYRLGTMVANL
jgi:Tfp pilus assembly protein PilV